MGFFDKIYDITLTCSNTSFIVAPEAMTTDKDKAHKQNALKPRSREKQAGSCTDVLSLPL